MVASGEAPSPADADAPLVGETLAQDPVAMEAEETLASGEGDKVQSLPADEEPGSSGPSGEGTAGTLEDAVVLFDKGSKAIEDGDFVDAVDCLSRALEIRVTHYGELAPECATSYYKYGSALLFKAQEEADPLGDVPKSTPRDTEKAKIVTNVEDCGSSKTIDNDANHDASNNKDIEEVSSEDDNEGSDANAEGTTEADEDESDLDLAWKMLELARAIVEKSPDDTMEKVNIFSALGEVSAEREDIETSLNDYLKALTILERLAEPDSRRMVELNFRISLVLEIGSKSKEAIPYCQKAISLCKSRLQRLQEDTAKSTGVAESNVNSIPVSDKSCNQLSASAASDHANPVETEVEALTGILADLERKLEDLQQTSPNPAVSEVLRMLASRPSSTETAIPPSKGGFSPLNSSQMGAITDGFDSPAMSTGATNGGVTHLGVVGRGVKRAVVTPAGAGPPSKKTLSEASSQREGSSISEDVGSKPSDAETR